MEKVIKILLIDDDEDDYIITRDVLDEITSRKYHIDWISNYKDGLQAIRHNVHDVYLVDYSLGSQTGLDIIRESVESGCDKPIILLTGRGDMEVDELAMAAGATDYIFKGNLAPYQLERSIRYSIQHKRNLNEIKQLNEELEERVLARTRELAITVKKFERTNKNLERQVKERRQAERALLESQRLYNTIAHNFPNGIINVLDQDFRYVFTDGQGLKELQLSKESLIGKSIFKVIEGKTFRSNLLEVLKGRPIQFEHRFFDIDYVVNAVPLADVRGLIHQILVVAQNITRQKKAEQEIRNALSKEKELNELKTRFVSMASHEFRTPLSTIMSSASLIEKYQDTSFADRRVKHINRIKSNVNNLTNILNDFLSLSRLEEGIDHHNPELFKLPELTNEVCEEMQEVARKDQNLSYVHSGEKDEVCIDKHILKNVLINLLSNAIKYSEEGDPIEIFTHLENGLLKLQIVDHGIGIPEKEQQHLFQRFFRANNAMNIQGTGLGLNIVKKYVDIMRGRIEFKSQKGKGSTFTVYLPNLAGQRELEKAKTT